MVCIQLSSKKFFNNLNGHSTKSSEKSSKKRLIQRQHKPSLGIIISDKKENKTLPYKFAKNIILLSVMTFVIRLWKSWNHGMNSKNRNLCKTWTLKWFWRTSFCSFPRLEIVGKQLNSAAGNTVSLTSLAQASNQLKLLQPEQQNL